jgi:hypothetical protein
LRWGASWWGRPPPAECPARCQDPGIERRASSTVLRAPGIERLTPGRPGDGPGPGRGSCRGRSVGRRGVAGADRTAAPVSAALLLISGGSVLEDDDKVPLRRHRHARGGRFSADLLLKMGRRGRGRGVAGATLRRGDPRPGRPAAVSRP